MEKIRSFQSKHVTRRREHFLCWLELNISATMVVSVFSN